MNNNEIVKYSDAHRPTVKIIIAAAIAAVIAITSFTAAAEHFSKPETYENTIESLDDKRNDVLAMSASSASISTALTLLPNDIASPIADNLADLSTTLMIVLCAIFLEKYLLTLAGLLTFKFMIPIACILFIVYLFSGRRGWAVISAKLAMLGVCIVILVPMSTWATGFIEDTYSVSIQENVQEAENAAEIIDENKDEDEGFLMKLFNETKEGAESMYNKVKNLLSNFIEAAAILIITSCIIPVLTLWLLIWVTNTILGVNISIPKDRMSAFARSGSRLRNSVRRKAIAGKPSM